MKRLLSIIFICSLIISCAKESTIPDTPVEMEEEGYNFPEGKIYFNVLPLDLDGVVFFEPMGLMGVFPQDHGGFHHNQIGAAEPSIAVYAMADGQINGLGKAGLDNWIQIQYSTTVSVKLGHIGDLADFIIDQTGPLVDGKETIVTIDVKEGQIIGYVSAFSALDIGLFDLESEKSFFYPDIFHYEILYAASIFEYFKEPLKSQLLEKAIREQEPRGGKVDYDVKGTLAGNWFIPNSGINGDAVNHFAIGYDHIHPHRIGIFDGYARFSGELEDPYSFYWIKNNGPLPETATVGSGLLKYEMIPKRGLSVLANKDIVLSSLDGVDEQQSRGVMLFEMLESEKMQVEFFANKLPENVNGFSGAQRIYVRKP